MLRPLVAILIGASSCAYYSQEDGERLNSEVYALQTQVTAMQQSLSELKDSSKTHTEQLAKLEAQTGELSRYALKNDADLGVKLDEMMEETARMRGRVEGFSERVSNLEAQGSKVQEELEARFADIAKREEIAKASSEEAKQRAAEDAKKREKLLGNADAVFKEAQVLLDGGQPAEARKLLRELERRAQEKKRPEKDRAEAQYLIGETYFAEGQFQQAAAEYNEVRKKYTRSKRVPDALYKLGMCFEKLNLKEDAKLFYETVTQKYKNTSVAKDAAQRLKKL